MRQGRLVDENGGPFLAVEYVRPPHEDDGLDEPCSVAGLIEVTLRKGRMLRVPVSIPPSVLTALIKAAEAA